METVRAKAYEAARMTVCGAGAAICFIGVVALLLLPVLEALGFVW